MERTLRFSGGRRSGPSAATGCWAAVSHPAHGKSSGAHDSMPRDLQLAQRHTHRAFRRKSRLEPQQVPVVEEWRRTGPDERCGSQQRAMPPSAFMARPCLHNEWD